MSEGTLLQTVEHETATPVDGAVLWLHGLGADGHDFEPVVPELAASGLRLRFVFPHAPVRPVTLNGGIPMRAWFDIYSLDRMARSEEDEDGVRTSEQQVHALIRRENERGVPTEKIVLAGFSQGGAIALHTAVRYPEKLAGVLALSTYMPLVGKLDAEAGEANRATPILIGHGTMDPMVPIGLGSATRDILEERGYPVEWKDYPMPHAVCPEEIRDVRAWLDARYAG